MAQAYSSKGAEAESSEVSRRRKEISAKYASWRDRWPQVMVISAKELNDRVQSSKRDDWVLVDIRTRAEQSVSMIPRAITQEQFESRLESIKASGKIICCYCTAGYRSGEYAASLVSRHQFESSRVFNLEGSILSWTHEVLPLVTLVDGKEVSTLRVHVFNPSWSLEGPGFIPVLDPQPLWEIVKGYLVSIFNPKRR